MKKIFSNYRYYVLFVLGLITTISFFAVPDDELPALSWVYVLVSSKVITLLAGFTAVRLFTHWEQQDKIKELTKFINEL